MSNRRQKAMEDRHIKMTPRKGNKITMEWPVDDRPLTSVEAVKRNLKFYRRWNSDQESREMYARNYKNGAEIFDLVIAIEVSPLNRALS